MNIYNNLKKKISCKKAVVAIVGLGFVGLPLAMAYAKRYKVIGYEVMKDKIDSLKKGSSYIPDAPNSILRRYLNKSFFPTTDEKELRKADFIIIIVPTPLQEKKPDITFIRDACETVSRNLRKGQFIILESTTYPGTTEEIVVPLLEKSGLKVGKDFGAAYSPERIDPGNKEWTVENTPKLVGGIDSDSGDVAQMLYSTVIKAKIYKVSNPRIAEATKLVENLFREVNIALMNEFALMFEKMGIDIWEVIEAAKTKPHAFMAHYPGPGIGGHCLPINPYYLLYEAERFDVPSRMLEIADEINDQMRVHTANLARDALLRKGIKISNAKITVMGLAYKKDINDLRETPAQTIIEELVNQGAKVTVYDPWANSINTSVGELFSAKSFDEAARGSDCLVFVTDHSAFAKPDWNKIKKEMRTPIVVDSRNMFKQDELLKKGFEYRGIGKPIKD